MRETRQSVGNLEGRLGGSFGGGDGAKVSDGEVVVGLGERRVGEVMGKGGWGWGKGKWVGVVGG